MKNREFLMLFFGILMSLNSNGQKISDLALKICDSIYLHKNVISDTLEFKHSAIYSKFLSDYVANKGDNSIKNFKDNFNSTNYKLAVELQKTCKSFQIKPLILPFSNLIEIDSIFSEQQSEKINKIAADIRNRNRLEVIILSVEDFYPDENITEFSINKLIDWRIGGIFEKSGVIIVFSTKLKSLRIATTEISKIYLNDSDCDKLVSEILIPNFKKGNYFKAIFNTLTEIQHITK
jgi:hypothetical protein